MATRGGSRAVYAYVCLLAGSLISILAGALGPGLSLKHIPEWLFLVALFAATEYAFFSVHDEDTRFGLSPSEAVLLPMVVALSFDQVVLGVALAGAGLGVVNWREGWMKGVFNTASFGCAAAGGAAVFALVGGDGIAFTPRNALAGALGVAAYALFTHVFMGGVMWITQRRSLVEFTRAMAPPTLLNLAGTLTVGLLFAGSYAAARWSVLLFPLPLAALFLGYRAVLRQRRERARIEYLHAAGTSLAASPDLDEALSGFLVAAADLVSSDETRAVISRRRQLFWSAVRSGEVIANMEPLESGPMLTLLNQVSESRRPLVVTEDAAPELLDLASKLGAQNFVAVPLMEGKYVSGVLVGLNRRGLGAFGDPDARVLEAMASELALRLDAYRLFAQVAEERERFRRIYYGSQEGICLLDDRGIVKAWNPALERITGFSEDEILDTAWWDRLTIRDERQRRLTGMDLVEVDPGTELEVVTREGPARWISVLSGTVQEESEQASGWVILIRDITTERAAEEAKSDFLSTISHELRTPLTTIKGALQMLNQSEHDVPEELQDQMVGLLNRGTDRLERLLMNLLFVSQVESGSVTFMSEEVQLEDLVRRRVESILAGREGVTLDVEERGLIVRADRERFGHVVEHLLENAAKHGGPGPISVRVGRTNGYARISVSDAGPGIPRADHDRIFERFSRLGHVLTREAQGAGVGLFIVRRSIEAMGGVVTVESEAGRGATFHITIPLAHPVAVSDSAS